MDTLVQEAGEGLVVTAERLAELLAPAAIGERLQPGEVLGWIRRGVRFPDGTVVRLEGLTVTTLPAVRRFLARLAEARDRNEPRDQAAVV